MCVMFRDLIIFTLLLLSCLAPPLLLAYLLCLGGVHTLFFLSCPACCLALALWQTLSRSGICSCSCALSPFLSFSLSLPFPFLSPPLAYTPSLSPSLSLPLSLSLPPSRPPCLPCFFWCLPPGMQTCECKTQNKRHVACNTHNNRDSACNPHHMPLPHATHYNTPQHTATRCNPL